MDSCIVGYGFYNLMKKKEIIYVSVCVHVLKYGKLDLIISFKI